MKKTLLLFFIAAMYVISANAQLTESFDGLVFPPTGWTSVVISVGDGATNFPGGEWDRVTVSDESPDDPAINPHSGAGMARYDSYDFDSLSVADLITPAMDFSSGLKRVSFWMYRSATYQREDSVTVYVNTTASGTGATFLGTVHRVFNRDPVVGDIGWYQYYYDIPASFNGTSNYIIFRGSGEYGLSIVIDDVVVANQPTCRPVTAIRGSNYDYAAGTASFTWTPPVIGSPVGYEWALNTTGIAPANGTAVAGTTVAISGITSDVINYIYIRSSCGGGDFSTWDSLAFAALPCAVTSAPASGATGVPQNQVFSWAAVPGADSYTFYLGLTAGTEVNIGSVSVTSTPVPNLRPLTAYSWYIVPRIGTVRAINTCTSNGFTTGAEPNTPVNNTCAGAIAITSANIAGNAIASTTVGSTLTLPGNLCNDAIGSADDDVWFEFTTSSETPTGSLTITPNGTRGISDVVAQVYAATSCTSLGTPVACADQTTGSVAEVVDLSTLSANTHYYMRVYSWDNMLANRGGFTITASGGSTLPIKLASFTARRSNGVNILNWSTEQELNTRYYAVERSSDGRNFTNIGQVNASGTSHSERRYRFTDSRT